MIDGPTNRLPLSAAFRRIAPIYSSAIFCVGLFSTFAGQLLLGKVISPEDFGTYILIYSTAAILSAVGSVGFDVSAVRFVSVANSNKNHAQLNNFIGYALQRTLLMSILAAAVGGLYLWLVDAVNGEALLLSIGVILVWGATRSLSGILRGLGGLSIAIGIDRVARDLAVFFVALALFVFSISAGLIDALMPLFTGGLLGLFIGFLSLQRNIGRIQSKTQKAQTKDKKEWRNTSFGLMLYNLTELLSSRFDIILLSFFIAKDEIGVLGILMIMMNICAIPSVFIGIYIMPKLAIAGQTQDSHALRRVGFAATSASVGLGAVISIAMFALQDPMLRFLGPAFSDSIETEVVGIALLIRCLSLIGTFPAAYLTMTGGHKKLLALNLSSIAFRILTYALLSTYLGATLGVLAFACAALGVSVGNFMLIRKPLTRSA